jgi:type IX secretion system substrate protein
MRIILAICILFCSELAYSQWSSFYTSQKAYYQIKESYSYPADTTFHQFHYDTIIDYGSFKVMHSNYTNRDFNGCYDVVNHNIGNSIYSKYYIRPDSILLKNDTTYFIYQLYQGQADSILFLTESQPNDTWIASISNSANYNRLEFTCDSVGVGNVLLNINDSLKFFSVKAFQNSAPVTSVYDSLTIILSKNHGFKQLIAFRDYNQQAFNLVGLDSTNIKTGFSYPDFSTYFHLSVGDVIIWKEHSPIAGPLHMGYTKYHKDSVTNSLITPDSVIYNFDRVTTGGGNTSSFTSKFYRENLRGLEMSSSVYVLETSLTAENFVGVYSVGNYYKDLYETSGAYVTDDTIINRKYSFVGHLFDISNCSMGYVTDNGYDYEYNTYYGLNSFKHYSFYDVYFTIESSLIDGVQIGDDWATIIASVDENDIDKLIQIYPNPSNDGNITILHEEIINSIAVYSIDGKLILTKQVNNNDFQTNLVLPKGVYFIHIEKNNSTLRVAKVVVTG